MAGFSLWPAFGQSNKGNSNQQQQQPQANNQGTQGGQQQQYEPRQTQLQPKNNNMQPNPPGTQQTQVNGDPNNNADPSKGQGSPLDGFRDLFTLPASDDPTNQQVDPFEQPLMAFDATKLTEAANKLNFAGQVTPEQITKIFEQRDPQALADLVNGAARKAFLAAATMGNQMVESGVRTNNQRFQQVLPDRIRQVQVRQQASENPVLNHPAAQPMLDMMKELIAQKNPNLSPTQVATEAERYLTTFGNEVTAPQRQQQELKNRPAEPDYSAFLP